MKNFFKAIWIDDSPTRKTSAKNLEKQLNISCPFLNVKGRDIIEELEKVVKQKLDIIFIDHRLDKNINKMLNGPATAKILRDKLMNVPIVSVTAVDIEDISASSKLVYDEIIKGDKIRSSYSLIQTLINSYHQLRKQNPTNYETLVDLFKPPNSERERIISILPRELKKASIKSSDYKLISDWTRKKLINYPGPLIDRHWVATIIGVKFESFDKIEKYFKNSLYNGIFKDQNDNRWWKSVVINTLSNKFPNEHTFYPWYLGRKFSEIDESDYSKCYKCGKDFPEVVGYTDEEAKNKKQLHLSHSVPHPLFEKQLYFEEIRILADD
ncbi:MAG: hypothetical protein KKD86_04725 [Bacteroidetes bacterium]|nr:hypothetical protein [Bacteroidota bacterium]